MPHTVTAQMTAHLSGETITLATVWSITRVDGTVYRFTDHDKDVEFGGDLYSTGVGYDRSAIADKSDLSVDNMDVQGILSTSDISRSDIRAGLFDNAEVYIRIINWQAPDDGAIIRRRGWFGEVRQNNLGQFNTELRGMVEALSERIGGVFTPGCPVDLGSAACGRLMAPAERVDGLWYNVGDEMTLADLPGLIFRCTTDGYVNDASGYDVYTFDQTIGVSLVDGEVTWLVADAWSKTSTVLASPVPDRRTFGAIISQERLTLDPTFYNGGLATFTSGANAGISREIKTGNEDSGGEMEFVTFLRFPYNIAAGDAFTIYPGCSKTIGVCTSRFANAINFQGFPHVPGDDYLTNYPEPKT